MARAPQSALKRLWLPGAVLVWITTAITGSVFAQAGDPLALPAGPMGGTVNAIAVDPAHAGTLYVATQGAGVFKSTNGGLTWVAINNGKAAGTFAFALAVDPANSAIVFVGTGAGVFRSADGGASWTSASAGLTSVTVSSLAIDSVTGAIYAGTNGGGVFKSTNNGQLWTPVNTGLNTSSTISALTVEPGSPSTVYAGVQPFGASGGVFKSTDGGATWGPTALAIGSFGVRGITVDAAHPGTVYVANFAGLFKSADYGVNWSVLNPAAPGTPIAAIAVDPIQPLTLYAVGTVVYRSNDGGLTWVTSSTGFFTRGTGTAVVVDPLNHANIYAGASNGFFVSNSGGGAWMSSNAGLAAANVYALAMGTLPNGKIYAGTNGAGVFSMLHSGSIWAGSLGGPASPYVETLAVDPFNSLKVYAGTRCTGVERTTDGGQTWVVMAAGLTSNCVYRLVIDPLAPATLYAGTNGGVFKTVDGAVSWTPANVGLPAAQINALAIDPTHPATLVAGVNNAGLFKSDDAGATWNPINAGFTAFSPSAVAIDPTNSAIMLAAGDNKIFKTVNGGSSWSLSSTGLADFSIRALAIDRTSPSTVFAATYGGVYKSTNGGLSWVASNTGLAATGVASLLIDSVNSSWLYAGTYSGVYRSIDGGETWSPADLLGASSGFEGQVIDQLTGIPMAGVAVSIVDGAGVFLTTVTTDITGRYKLAGLSAGTYRALASGAGYVPQLYDHISCSSCAFVLGTPVSVVAGAITPNINFALLPLGRITGRVTGPGGAFLPNVTVQLMQLVSSPPAPPQSVPVKSAVTRADGSYEFLGLTAGTYYVFTSATGYINEAYDNIQCTVCSTVIGTPIPVADGLTVANIDFGLAAAPAGGITGRVTRLANGAGIPSVAVQIYSAQTGTFGPTAFTVADGTYSVGGLPPGTYFAWTINNAGFVDQVYSNISCSVSCAIISGTPIAVAAGAVTTGINFALPEASRITGRVTSAATGAAVPAVSVAIFHENGTFASSAFTDASGNYSSANLTPGTYYARTSNALGFLDQLYAAQPCTPGCAPTAGTPIVVQPGAATTGISFVLSSSGRISGNVRSDAGAPLSGIAIEIYRDDGVAQARVFTDPSGNYTALTNLGTGTYFVKTSNGNRWIDEVFDNIPCVGCDVTTGTPVPVFAGTTTPGINFALAAGGSIAGRVTNAATGLGVFSSVQIFDAAGVFVASAVSDGSGNYVTSTGLPTGNYRARTSNTAGLRDRLFNGLDCALLGCDPRAGTPIAVSGGVTTNSVNFALAAFGEISGIVRNAAGVPLGGATVRVFTPNGVPMGSGSAILPTGAFTVRNLPAGSYYAIATASGYKQQGYGGTEVVCVDMCSPGGNLVAVGDGQKVTGIDFALNAGGRISGHIANALTHANLSSITAEIYNASNELVARAGTDGSGNYTSDIGLATGNYYLRTRNVSGYIDQLFSGLTCVSCTPSTGMPIGVIEGATTPNINLDLSPGSRISGNLLVNGQPFTGSAFFSQTDSAGLFVTTAPTDGSGNYQAGNFATVNIFDGSGTFVTSATTDSSGNYSSKAGLPDGTYYAASTTSAGLSNMLYNQQPCGISCNPLAGTPIVVAGQNVVGINFNLSKGGRIAGTIRDAVTGLPLRNVWVDVFNAANQLVATGYSATSGAYTTNQGLATGTYFARTRDTAGYRSELYHDMNCAPGACTPSAGTPITVTALQTTTYVDFSLTPGAPLIVPTVTWNNPADITYPTALGPMQLNASATVPGTSTPVPGTFEYTPGAGTVLSPGAGQILSVKFMPADTSTYTIAQATATINVLDVPLAVTVVHPNGGERVFVGVPELVTWTKAGSPTSFDVLLSTNAGLTFSPIAGCAPLSGAALSCAWTPPVPTTDALIRVVAHDVSGTATDTSNAVFQIAAGPPVVTVTSPNTAGTWRSGTVHNITFDHNLGIGASVDLAVSRDGGAHWTPVTTVITETATSGKFLWTVTGPETTHALVRAEWTGHAGVSDVSDVEFAISSRITLTFPKAAVVWAAGSIRQITWKHNLGPTDAVDVDFSADGGGTWTRLASGIANDTATTGSYTGKMPDTQTTYAMIRVSQTGAPDESGVTVPFTLAAPSIEVTAPDTNKWMIGAARTFKWSHNLGINESVRVELSRNNGASWEVLEASVANSGDIVGKFDWIVTGPATATALVRVTWLSGNGTSGVSAAAFRIQ